MGRLEGQWLSDALKVRGVSALKTRNRWRVRLRLGPGAGSGVSETVILRPDRAYRAEEWYREGTTGRPIVAAKVLSWIKGPEGLWLPRKVERRLDLEVHGKESFEVTSCSFAKPLARSVFMLKDDPKSLLFDTRSNRILRKAASHDAPITKNDLKLRFVRLDPLPPTRINRCPLMVSSTTMVRERTRCYVALSAYGSWPR